MGTMHGTTTGYAKGCRCDECRRAMNAYQRKRAAAMRAGTWQAWEVPRGGDAQQCSGPECLLLARYRNPQPLCSGHYQQMWAGKSLAPLVVKNRVTNGHKRCTKCGEVKPLSDYNARLHRVTPACRSCQSIINRCNKYGLTFDEVREMLRQPCQGCLSPVSGREIHIDHDHATGVVRGVLCHNCNTVLTKHMTPETLRRLAAYLEAGSSPV